jgi:hypothetical protein
MEDGVRDRIAKVSPFSGVAVVLLVTLGFWWWYKSHAEFEKG